MKHIWNRLWAETPTFFKRLRAFGLSLAGAGTAIVSIPNIPEKLSYYAGHAIWVGMVAAAVSQLTAKDPSQLQPQDQNKGAN